MTSVHFAPERPSTEPLLNFDCYAGRIVELIRHQRGGGAFVFAIHGAWGSGKTTLMKAVEDRLSAAPDVAPAEDASVAKSLIVNFNAWKYQDRDVLWRALLLRVINEIEGTVGEEKTETIRESLYRAFEIEERGPITVNYKKLVVEFIGAVLKLWNLGFLTRLVNMFRPLGWLKRLFGGKSKDESAEIEKEDVENVLGIFSREVVRTQVHKVESIEQFLAQFEDLVGELGKSGRKLVVLVDDLDRCLPESSLEIFEAIKLFMDVDGVTFILCLDRGIIRKALKVRYERVKGSEDFVDPDEYIEKAITLAFQIPVMNNEGRKAYVESLRLSDRWTPTCLDIMRNGLEPNPRRIKRFCNGVEFLFDLVEASGRPQLGDLEREFLVKLYCLEYRWSPLFEAIAERPQDLLMLTKWVTADRSVEGMAQDAASYGPMIARAAEDREFHSFLKSPPVFTGLELEDLKKIISILIPAEEVAD